LKDVLSGDHPCFLEYSLTASDGFVHRISPHIIGVETDVMIHLSNITSVSNPMAMDVDPHQLFPWVSLRRFVIMIEETKMVKPCPPQTRQ
jgi:hypothetical protein